jgi:hypothetical protein
MLTVLLYVRALGGVNVTVNEQLDPTDSAPVQVLLATTYGGLGRVTDTEARAKLPVLRIV